MGLDRQVCRSLTIALLPALRWCCWRGRRYSRFRSLARTTPRTVSWVILWKLGVPFVWGPWGGTSNVPWGFLGEGSLTVL